MFEDYGFTVLDCIGIPVRMSKKAQETNVSPRMFCYLEMGSLDDAVLGLSQLSRCGNLPTYGVCLLLSSLVISMTHSYEEKHAFCDT